MAIPQGPRADPTPFAFGGGQSESGGLFGGAGFGDDKFARLLMGLALLDSGRPRVNPPSAMETIAPLVQMLGQQSSQKNAMNFMNKAFEPGAPNAAGLLGAGESASPDIPAGIQMPEQAPSAAPPVSGQMMTGGGIDDAAAQKMAGQYWPAVKAAAEQNGIPAGILAKQIAQESSFNPNAKSSAGALGISQFMPGTARRFGIDPLDPNQAIPAGAQYVAKNTAMFGGNLGLGLAGYNWGEGNVQKWLARGANPSAMPAETRKYVANITGKPIDAWVNGGGSDTPAATLIPTQAQGRVTPIPTQGTARVQYAQATPQTMTDASSGASQPADAPPTPVQSPRAAVGQAFAAGELPDVSTRQLQQAQAAMPNTVAPRSPETVTGSRTQAAYAMKMFDHWGRVAAGAGMLGTGGAGLIEYAKAQMDLAKTFMSEVQKKQLEADYAGVIKGRQTMAEHAAALPFIGPETQAKESVISKEMWNRPDASAALSGAKAGAAEQAKIAATVRSMGLDPASPEGQAAAARMQADNRPEPVKLLDAAGVQGPERSKALTGAITGSAPTPEQKNFEYGKGAPGFEQYQLQQKQAGRPLNLGTIPEGYQLVATPDGTYRMQKVPGSAADIAEQQKAVAANRSKDIVTQEIDRALPMIGYTTSGTLGAVTQNIPGMPGHDLQNLIGTIRANVGIDSLQQMRASSPTGAALGNVTETENKTLQSVLGSLNQTQSPDQLRENLTRLRAVYHDIVFGSPGQLDALTRAGKITPEQRDAALAQRASPGQEGGLKPLDEGAATKARDAISKGAPRDAVIKRLRESGYDTNGL